MLGHSDDERERECVMEQREQGNAFHERVLRNKGPHSNSAQLNSAQLSNKANHAPG